MKQKMRSHIELATVMMLLLTAACGEIIETESDAEPLWVVKGAIADLPQEIEANVDLRNLRAALVWTVAERDEDGTMIGHQGFSQEAEIASTFPNTFEIVVYDLIPREYLIHNTSEEIESEIMAFGIWGHDGNASTTWDYYVTLGKLVVYEDRNQNGKLDFIGTDDEEKIDHIVGGALNYDIFYFESEMEEIFPNRPDLTSGINILSRRTGNIENAKKVPLREELEVHLEDRIENQLLMCKDEGIMWLSGTPLIFDDFYDCWNEHHFTEFPDYVSSHVVLSRDGICTDDGRIFQWRTREFDSVPQYPCQINLWEYTSLPLRRFEVPSDVDIPAYWPCEEGEHHPDDIFDSFFETVEECEEDISTTTWRP